MTQRGNQDVLIQLLNHTKNARNTILVDVLHTGHSSQTSRSAHAAQRHTCPHGTRMCERGLSMQTTQSWFSLSMLKNKVVGDKYVYVK